MLNKSKNHDTFERGIIKQNIRLHKRETRNLSNIDTYQ